MQGSPPEKVFLFNQERKKKKKKLKREKKRVVKVYLLNLKRLSSLVM